MKAIAITSLILALFTVAGISWLCFEILEGRSQVRLLRQDVLNLQKGRAPPHRQLLENRRAVMADAYNRHDAKAWVSSCRKSEGARSQIIARRGNSS